MKRAGIFLVIRIAFASLNVSAAEGSARDRVSAGLSEGKPRFVLYKANLDQTVEFLGNDGRVAKKLAATAPKSHFVTSKNARFVANVRQGDSASTEVVLYSEDGAEKWRAKAALGNAFAVSDSGAILVFSGAGWAKAVIDPIGVSHPINLGEKLGDSEFAWSESGHALMFASRYSAQIACVNESGETKYLKKLDESADRRIRLFVPFDNCSAATVLASWRGAGDREGSLRLVGTQGESHQVSTVTVRNGPPSTMPISPDEAAIAVVSGSKITVLSPSGQLLYQVSDPEFPSPLVELPARDVVILEKAASTGFQVVGQGKPSSRVKFLVRSYCRGRRCGETTVERPRSGVSNSRRSKALGKNRVRVFGAGGEAELSLTE